MAYYLQSLVRVIELIICHEKQHEYFDDHTTPQLQSLLEKACYLRDAFADHPILSHQQQDSFEDQIRDAAQDAEDVLETYVASFATDDEGAITSCFTQCSDLILRDMQMLHESFDFLKKEMMKILDADRTSADHTAVLVAASTRIDRNPENIVVGKTDDLLQLKDRVFGESSKLEIIPIVGMGGIGKTTLARKLYEDTKSEFDARAWATVSDDYSLRDILLDLLDKKRDEMVGVEDNTLRLTVYQKLKGQRYMVVLDDIWRSNAWDDAKKCFPNENKGSRIILTTRQSHVATYVDSKSLHHQVCPLDQDDSWELLRRKALSSEETCLPNELEKLGRRIANDCGGLPLAVQVIGGILSQTERKKSSWEEVASEVISAIANEDEIISNILALSYNNLPYYLKPCFLYMSVFPEDFLIEPSTLIRLWVAEGFLIPIIGKSLEMVAVEHFHALIDRNLIFVRRQSLIGEIETLGIHDLLRDLCILEASKKKFFHVVNRGIDHRNASRDMSCLRRVSVVTPSLIEDIYGSTRQKQLARSLITFKLGEREDVKLPHGLSTLRLLSMFEMQKSVNEAANLRYLSLECGIKLNPRITILRNLQFLIIEGGRWIKVPHEVFKMPQLREIVANLKTTLYCDFKESSSENHLVLQENLHSLPTLYISDNIDVVLAKFPNLKELGLKYSFRESADPIIMGPTISSLRKIEKLNIFGDRGVREVANYLMECSFSSTLTKLTLKRLNVPEAFMTRLGMLPNLEHLTLHTIGFEDTEVWKLSEGKFCRLKSLHFQELSLVTWEADETHFPILEILYMFCCIHLHELPSSIGEIPTLQKITVHFSSRAAEAWARQIQEEQLDYGNQLLKVKVIKDI